MKKTVKRMMFTMALSIAFLLFPKQVLANGLGDNILHANADALYNKGDSIEKRIPNDAFEFQGHYYKAYYSTKSWDEAKSYCEELGGHLATITSESELKCIRENVKTYYEYWLGGTDKYNEGIWCWITNEEWTYSYWKGGEPNDDKGNEEYLVMFGNSGLWNDKWLKDINVDAFICEWDNYSGKELEVWNKNIGIKI